MFFFSFSFIFIVKLLAGASRLPVTALPGSAVM